MTVLSTKKTGGSCRRCLLIQYDFYQAVYNFSWWREKESIEIRKRLLWEMKLIDWPKYSSVLWKRVVGAFQKTRRCSAKESSVLSKRIDDAKRKQSIYSQISINCYAVGSSCLGIDVEADYFVEFRRKEVGYTLHVSIWVRFLQIYLPPSKHIKVNMIHNFKNFVTFLEWFSLRGWCFDAVVFISLD